MNIKELLKQLTLEEKAGLVSGADNWHTKAVERLGIPAITLSDGPHGVRTADANPAPDGEFVDAVCFPAACATAASFDGELLEEIGGALGDECNALGVAVLLGPAANIKRSPLCGRNFEYISEDPYLTGRLAAALIGGIQSKGVGTSMKHFAANNQEHCRINVSADVDERTLREIYLAGFEYAVKTASPWTLMCSYNRINGVYSSENPWLLTDVLRKDWGFEGFVMSDWGACDDRIKGVPAGLDLEMPGGMPFNAEKLVAAVKAGEMSEAALDLSVERILRIVDKYASNPTGAERGTFEIDYDTHNALALKAATESAVLLKNEGNLLPLNISARVAFIGGFAEKPRYQGGGSSNVKSHKVTSALDIVAALPTGRFTYAKGFDIEGDKYDDALATEAVKAAKSAEVAVIFAGLPDSFESEGYDRPHMQLPNCQTRLIAKIMAVQQNIVIVLHNGSPVEMPWVDNVPAILEMYLGGQAVGEATINLLFGLNGANPSGKLAETFPQKLEDNPSYLNFPGTPKSVKYAEGVFVGYRYYSTKETAVLFPFGHGLSYTTFEYGDMEYDKDEMTDAETLTVSVDVTNTGEVRGKEIVQLYVENDKGGFPDKQLKGFVKLELEPGETKKATFELDYRAFAYWDEAGNDWFVQSKMYDVSAGSSSEELLCCCTVFVAATRFLPLVIDRDTAAVELLADPRYRAKARKIFIERGKMEPKMVDNALHLQDWNNLEMPLRIVAMMCGMNVEEFVSEVQLTNNNE